MWHFVLTYCLNGDSCSLFTMDTEDEVKEIYNILTNMFNKFGSYPIVKLYNTKYPHVSTVYGTPDNKEIFAIGYKEE